MLTQLNNSSKRLSKLKKYKHKIDREGFDFLMRSMERQKDKENYLPNNFDPLRQSKPLNQSIGINPIMTMPVNSFKLSCNSSLQLAGHQTAQFFFDNVKQLDKSDASISQKNNSNKSQYKSSIIQKNTEKEKHKQRNSSRQNSPKSKIGDAFSIPKDLIYKIKQYLCITDEIFYECEAKKIVQKIKKSRAISEQLASLINKIERTEYESLSMHRQEGPMLKSIKTTGFNLNPVNESVKQNNEFIKYINSLEHEKDKLQHLISQHQLANIKLYVRINEGQSKQIEMCKEELTTLFEKYKELEAQISKNKKINLEILKEKQEICHSFEKLKHQNAELRRIMNKYERYVAKLKQKKEDEKNSAKKNINIYIGSGISKNMASKGEKHQRINSQIFQFERSGNQRSLNLDELNSQSDSIIEQNMLGSSIATATSRMKKNKGTMGINLNALFQNIDYIHKLEDPIKLKKIIADCKQNILKMEQIINDQNVQLELSINLVNQYNTQIKQQESKMKQLEQKIGVLNSDKESKSTKHVKNSQSSINQKSNKKKEKSKLNFQMNPKAMNMDEYRIIAMQAEALEELVKMNRVK